jgi:hypothetical protein
LESSAEIDETSLQDVFQFSVRLRHQELVAHLSSRRFDVVAALEPLRTVDQKNSYERTYDYDLFKFMTKLSGPNLEPFWRDILIRDYRIKARKMAHDVLVAALGEAATQAIVAECDEAKVARQKLIRQKTRVLISRLHTLFACLRQYKIFAVDIYGSGWAPGDHGSEVAHAMICPNDLNEFGVANDSDMSICWTDTGYYKKEARGWSKKGRMQKAVTAVNIYYAAPTQSKSKEMASRITDIAVANGFQADWNGDTNQAVSLYLM